MTLADLAWCVEDVRSRLKPYATARAYDEGNHRLVFATEKYRNTFGDLFREFADNMCDDVVDGITDRLQITGWSAVSDSDDATDTGAQRNRRSNVLAAEAAEVWERIKGPARTGAVHRNAFREGDGFAIVQEGSDGHAYYWRQRPEQMAVRYSTDLPDVIDLAGKVWKAGKRYRATLFYPDGRVERYATKGLGAEGGLPQARAFTLLAAGDPDLKDGGEAVTESDDGLGMPVYHYPNGELSEYGRSVIAKVIPIQDALNKSVADMLVAMEYHAYPQRWATGVQVEYGPDGEERSPFQAGESRVWRVGSHEAKMGQFDPASMEGFLSVQDSFRLEIARKGALPPHAVNLRSGTAAPVSGIGLLVVEGRQVKWARDRQRDWGGTHRDAMAHMLKIEGHRQAEAADLSLQWAPPETRDMKALLEEAALKLDMGVPLRQVLLEIGYSPDEIQSFLDEAEATGEAEELARDMLSGGRRTATKGQALGIPAGPVPPSGSGTPLAS